MNYCNTKVMRLYQNKEPKELMSLKTNDIESNLIRMSSQKIHIQSKYQKRNLPKHEGNNSWPI